MDTNILRYLSLTLLFPNSNFNNYFQYGLALLALCQAGVEIDTTYVQEIIDGQTSAGAYQFGSGKYIVKIKNMDRIAKHVNKLKNDNVF